MEQNPRVDGEQLGLGIHAGRREAAPGNAFTRIQRIAAYTARRLAKRRAKDETPREIIVFEAFPIMISKMIRIFKNNDLWG
jgi:hypothetical protein